MAEEMQSADLASALGSTAPDVQDTDDGGAIVAMSQDRVVTDEEDFFSNIADEFYRRFASPYEDEQITKNGDVYYPDDPNSPHA